MSPTRLFTRRPTSEHRICFQGDSIWGRGNFRIFRAGGNHAALSALVGFQGGVTLLHLGWNRPKVSSSLNQERLQFCFAPFACAGNKMLETVVFDVDNEVTSFADSAPPGADPDSMGPVPVVIQGGGG